MKKIYRWQSWSYTVRLQAIMFHLLQWAYSHLESGDGGIVGIAFFDFSSAFNTIQPLLLGGKLRLMGVHRLLEHWLPDSEATICQFWPCLVWCGGER